MQVIHVRNVNEALPEAIYRLENQGIKRDSRNGPVLMFDEPVTTVYEKPTERVMFWPQRDCNPFFHLFESLWMLGGRNDVPYLTQFVSSMRNFSDNGYSFNGAYGFRWKKYYGYDQLDVIIKILRNNKEDRRCVLQMWDAHYDLGSSSKDVPCNTAVYFSIDSSNKLNMTVTNRSNDLIWGAYGANAVHFSILQEYIASSIGVDVGKYWQVSNNLHAYEKTFSEDIKSLSSEAKSPFKKMRLANPYEEQVSPFKLISTDKKTWDRDLMMFLESGAVIGFEDVFFRRVVTPIYMAHKAYRDKTNPDRFDVALEILEQCVASDWKKATKDWVLRRKERAK